MSEYLGRSRLSEHDPDPESSDHSTPPGHWIVASCETSDALKAKHPEAKVFSSLTDISGEYGDPSMFTEWGLKDNCTPLWADLRYLPDCSNAYGEDSGSEARRDPKPCEHMIYVLEVRSLELTDAEWRAFQSIPEQGFSHRAWINARIAERVTARSDTKVIADLNALDAGDSERAHTEADDLLLVAVSAGVAAAYLRVQGRSDFWATS